MAKPSNSTPVSRRRKKPVQLGFSFRTWGGARKGAGRKPANKRAKAGVPHRSRPPLACRYPLHVTLKVLGDLPNLRQKECLRAIERALWKCSQRPDFRIVHYSIQKEHIHLLVEAHNAPALSRGMQGFCISIARRLNLALKRKGTVFADRFHSRILRTPLEVKRVLVYLLNNRRRHRPNELFHPRWMDPCTSADYFDGWHGIRGPPPYGKRSSAKENDKAERWLVARPKTCLIRVGWRRHGLIQINELPGKTFDMAISQKT